GARELLHRNAVARFPAARIGARRRQTNAWGRISPLPFPGQPRFQPPAVRIRLWPGCIPLRRSSGKGATDCPFYAPESPERDGHAVRSRTHLLPRRQAAGPSLPWEFFRQGVASSLLLARDTSVVN